MNSKIYLKIMKTLSGRLLAVVPTVLHFEQDYKPKHKLKLLTEQRSLLPWPSQSSGVGPMAHPQFECHLLIHLPKSHYRHHDAKEMGLWNLASDSVIDRMSIVMTFTESQLEMCEYLLRDNNTINLLRDEKFDVGISEIFALCGFGIFELANIPNLVGASAVGVVDTMNEFIDVPLMPSFMPSSQESEPAVIPTAIPDVKASMSNEAKKTNIIVSAFLSSYGEDMSFQQRFVNFFLHGGVSMASQLIRFRYERIFTKYGLYSGLREFISARINYVLSNSDEFLDFSWPKSDKLVHIGGITLPKTATLEEKFRLIMERHDRRGVILISFGSSVPTVQQGKPRKSCLSAERYLVLPYLNRIAAKMSEDRM
ncbi:unnamed protein product [Haemonchus placei]|uniref:glucuronosyltransferase n=1 Tax=Haemonchus placei TaxID=6290 RepID=A0A0N4VTP8_HAEPC|nr:unnamed protein product [Haemonchus placei]